LGDVQLGLGVQGADGGDRENERAQWVEVRHGFIVRRSGQDEGQC
jgi:hypothetical protein